jgi:RIO kinase 1
VLLMELVTDEHGDAAPRLNDVDFTPEDARLHHATLLTEVVRMLCAGVVHGDLSEFNILLGVTDGQPGPVIIDLPQAVDAAGNNHAGRMLLRDVANLRGFFGRFAHKTGPVNLGAVMGEIDDARAEESARRLRMQEAR